MRAGNLEIHPTAALMACLKYAQYGGMSASQEFAQILRSFEKVHVSLLQKAL